MADVAGMVERLRSIEDELRDVVFDALRERAAGGGDRDRERRLEQARRAVEKAARLLAAEEHFDD